MNTEHNTRRAFLKTNAAAAIGTIIGAGMMQSALGNFSPDANFAAGAEAEPIIDIHQHTNYNKRSDADLVTHQRAMGITATILLPAGHPAAYGSTYFGMANGLQAEIDPNEAAYNLAMKYPGEFLFAANEVPDLPGAIGEIEKYLKLGGKMIAECKFGVDCDSPEMQEIYKLADKYDVPVLMHWLHNTYNRGFDRFHKMVKKYHRVNFIGHAQTWWADIDKNMKNQNDWYPKSKVTPGGITDKLLDHPNVYGDFSGGSGFNAMNRDTEQAPDFLSRHQDKLLFGSDCWDLSGVGKDCIGKKTIAMLRTLCPNKTIERKILYENAKKLFKL